MVYVTGDCHAEFHKLNTKNFPEQTGMSKEDYVLICGDFGGIWERTESPHEKYTLDRLGERTFTTLFVDGNHENFDRLDAFPVSEWHGGKVHKIRPGVLHLMRGQVYEIDGQRIFTFGGASSHDISGGLLDPEDPEYRKKKRELDRSWEPYRVKHISWWEQELPGLKEMTEGLVNLKKVGFEVDYVITHCAPTSIQRLLDREGYLYQEDVATEYLERIREKCRYKKWYFGHYHQDCNVTDKETLLYWKLVKLGDSV